MLVVGCMLPVLLMLTEFVIFQIVLVLVLTNRLIRDCPPTAAAII